MLGRPCCGGPRGTRGRAWVKRRGGASHGWRGTQPEAHPSPKWRNTFETETGRRPGGAHFCRWTGRRGARGAGRTGDPTSRIQATTSLSKKESRYQAGYPFCASSKMERWKAAECSHRNRSFIFTRALSPMAARCAACSGPRYCFRRVDVSCGWEQPHRGRKGGEGRGVEGESRGE